MSAPRTWKEITAVVALFSFLCLFLPARPASAGWIATRPAPGAPQAELLSLLEREEVVAALEELGVDRAEAARRVAGLTDAEARDAIDRIQSLPAGGDGGIGVVVGALFLVFVILLVTDLLGLTRFYPFTKKR